ncbi:hypothetical protein MTO96_000073 [Rhipicephalus appendiculatus]
MRPGHPPAVRQQWLSQGNDAGDGPTLPTQPLQPAQAPDVDSLRSDRRRTFIAVGLCASVLFVLVVAYVSFMTTVELAALSQAKRDVTASASDGHRGAGRHPRTTKNTPPPPLFIARSNDSLVADV